MLLKNINNATTLVSDNNFKMIMDPWVIGDIYQNSWRPYPKNKIDNKWFHNIDYIFISHLHEDHFDLKTIKKINKNVKIIIPKLNFNNIIKIKLEKNGFKNIEMKNLSKWYKLNDHLSLYIIPPLNELAQELNAYANRIKDDLFDVAIDTGIILKDSKSKTNHVILFDNSPYNAKRLKLHCKNLKIKTFWFPYNGYASDYPLCYDNLSLKEKRESSLKMSLTREKATLKAIKLIKPEYLIPHSSDFYLNGPRSKEFYRVHDINFLDKKKYSERIEKKSGVKALALYSKDHILFENKSDFISIKTKEAERIKSPSQKKLSFPNFKMKKSNLKEDIKLSINAMFERAAKYKMRLRNINEWLFEIQTENKKFTFDLESREIKKRSLKNKNKKKFTLITSEKILRSILQGKIHLDNACIGNYLTWKRSPDKYNKTLHDLLFFFHLPKSHLK